MAPAKLVLPEPHLPDQILLEGESRTSLAGLEPALRPLPHEGAQYARVATTAVFSGAGISGCCWRATTP